MTQKKLTKSAVDRIEPKEKGEQVYWDVELPGFGLRVKHTGTKSFIVQYRNRSTGRSRRKTIGTLGPLMTLHQAKEIARGILSDVVRGADPVVSHREFRNAPSVAELAQRYLLEHAEPKKRSSSVKNDRCYLERHIIPRLGSMKVHEVRPQDVQALHNSIADTPYQANRVLALASKMFSLAVRWEARPDNPAKGIEKFVEAKRHRWLSDSELARLTEALDSHPNQIAANTIRLQLLTGARIGEVLTASWDDFDLERGVWTKPSHHTKQKRTEHLPLSSFAVELMERIHSTSTSRNYVFANPSTRKPYRDLRRFWAAVTTSAKLEDYRIHDNRHTHASHLVSSGMSLAIVGRLLGHTNPLTTQRYAHLADDPLREAAEIIGRKLSS